MTFDITTITVIFQIVEWKKAIDEFGNIYIHPKVTNWGTANVLECPGVDLSSRPQFAYSLPGYVRLKSVLVPTKLTDG